MKFVHYALPLLSLPTISLLPVVDARTLAPRSPRPFGGSCGIKLGPIQSTQRLGGKQFIGSSVPAKPLLPKIRFAPDSVALHADGGNTNTVDYDGPLGRDLELSTLNLPYGQFFWDNHGTMFSVYQGPCSTSPTNFTQSLVIVNPTTLEFEATWEPPAKYADTQLNFAYQQMVLKTDTIVVSALQGQIYVLQKQHNKDGSPRIKLLRLIDLTTSGVLKGQTLLNVALDDAGHVWFTTGALDGTDGQPLTNTTIMGYVEQDGTIHHVEVPNQSVGNGISVSNTTIFVNTEPSAKDDHANAVGFITALQPGPGTSVCVLWNATYDAGSAKRPGAFARGSGTTPTLLGNDFVAVTDNNNTQMNLLIYSQRARGQNVEPICKFPLFEPHSSWTDNGVMGHFDGKDYGVVVENMYNQNTFNAEHYTKNPDGSYNNLTSQSPGLWKVKINGDGSGCSLAWTNPGRMSTVPLLSTKTGLIYTYEQNKRLANEGDYIWYASAVDYDTGKTVWKYRTGTGGSFNNYYRTTFLSPNGTLYQLVQGGVVALRDRRYY